MNAPAAAALEFDSRPFAMQEEPHVRAIERLRDLQRMSQEQIRALLDGPLLQSLHELAIVAATDASGQIIYSNDEFCRVSKYARHELLGQQHNILNSGLHPETFFRELYDKITNGHVWRGDVRNKAKDGSFYWVDTTIFPVLGQDARPEFYVSIRFDITERIRLEEELRTSGDFLQQIIEHTPAALFVKKAEDLTYLLINDAAQSYYGKPRSSMIGKTVDEVFRTETARHIRAKEEDVRSTGVADYEGEHEVTTPGGSRRVVRTKRIPIRDSLGQLKYIVGVIEDVTEKAVVENQLAYLAYHDPLTGLGNREALKKYIAEAAESSTLGNSFAVICLDLDQFKEVNDSAGHAAGDEVLCQTADRLRQVLPKDRIARVGGDEFVVVLTSCPTTEEVASACERIHQALLEEISAPSGRFQVGVSAGIAMYPTDGRDAETLCKLADIALYRAKEEGRRTTRFFEAQMDKHAQERRTLRKDLGRAVPQNELVLHYQPQTTLDGTVTGFEALVRWNHPTRGLVSPASFIPFAEETGLILPIGNWVLEEACREAVRWRSHLSIAVNVSPLQFRRGDLVDRVRMLLLQTGLCPARLEIEITEGVLIEDAGQAIRTLTGLKELGVRVAMDDFGTGYSSLSYLHAFPFDKIKIDRSFIVNSTENEQSAAIVRAVIGLGKSLRMPVVAEGVEVLSQMDLLREEKCDFVQGYLFGKPAAISTFSHVVLPTPDEIGEFQPAIQPPTSIMNGQVSGNVG